MVRLLRSQEEISFPKSTDATREVLPHICASKRRCDEIEIIHQLGWLADVSRQDPRLWRNKPQISGDELLGSGLLHGKENRGWIAINSARLQGIRYSLGYNWLSSTNCIMNCIFKCDPSVAIALLAKATQHPKRQILPFTVRP